MGGGRQSSGFLSPTISKCLAQLLRSGPGGWGFVLDRTGNPNVLTDPPSRRPYINLTESALSRAGGLILVASCAHIFSSDFGLGGVGRHTSITKPEGFFCTAYTLVVTLPPCIQGKQSQDKEDDCPIILTRAVNSQGVSVP